MSYSNHNNFDFVICLALLFVSSNVIAQHSRASDTTDTKYITVAQEIMSNAGTCALITLDKEGRPRVRVDLLR